MAFVIFIVSLIERILSNISLALAIIRLPEIVNSFQDLIPELISKRFTVLNLINYISAVILKILKHTALVFLDLINRHINKFLPIAPTSVIT